MVILTIQEPPIGLGDLPGWSMVALMCVVNLVGLWLIVRDSKRSAVDRAAEKASAEATNNSALDALAKEFAKLSTNLEKITGEFTDHRIEDREVHTRLSETQAMAMRLLERYDERVTTLERRPRRAAV